MVSHKQGPANLLYCMYCIVSVLSPCTGSTDQIFGSILILYKNKKKLGDDTLNNSNIELSSLALKLEEPHKILYSRCLDGSSSILAAQMPNKNRIEIGSIREIEKPMSDH